MADALTHLFTQFHFQTDLFFVGQLCRISGGFNETNKGYLHFIRQGSCILNEVNGKSQKIDRPCIIFSPSNVLHSIHPIENGNLEIFCVSFDFGLGIRNPLNYTEHNISLLFLDDKVDLLSITEQIFNEVEQQQCGCQAAIHHLCAYLTIQVIRHCLAQGLLKKGLLPGLLDKQLGLALLEIHKQPEKDWSVEELAELALMSRSRFAAYFKQIVGLSPMEYLTNWRITLAQSFLQKGLSVAQVAEKVGYSHNAALTRVFVREIGKTPTQWLASNRKSAV